MRKAVSIAVSVVAALAALQSVLGRSPSAQVISPLRAMEIAKQSSGMKPGMAIYEFDEGKWIYSVPVGGHGKLKEVAIDPKTGKVLETENVDAGSEAKEFSADLAKLSKG